MKHEDIRLADAYPAPDPRFHAATLRTLNQIRARDVRRSASIPLRAALIAAALLIALTAIGFASGTFQSIFTYMTHAWTDGPTTDYAHLEDAAAQDVSRQSLNFANGARATVTLEQSYYNGEQLALGWSLRPEGEFAWFFAQDDSRYTDLHPELEEYVAEDGQVDMIYHGLEGDLADHIGTEAAEEFARRLEENGWAGVAWYDCYMGDSVYLPNVPEPEYSFDGSIAGTADDTRLSFETQYRWHSDGLGYLYQEFGTLPDAARDVDVLQTKAYAHAALRWYCEDASGRYYGYASDHSESADERMDVLVDIPRSEDYEDQSHHADATFPAHTASIDLRMTPIYVEYSIENEIPDAWKAVWNDPQNFPDDKYPPRLPMDVIWRYEFYAEIGDALQALPDSCEIGEETLYLSGTFILPDGASELHIRPVYYNSGAHADEDIIILLG